MRFPIDLYIRRHPEERPPLWAEDLLDKLGLLLDRQDILMTDMNDVRAAVKRNNDAGDSFRTYIKGVIDKLKEANQNPAGPSQEELAAIISDLDRGAEADVAAMQENTEIDPNAPAGDQPSA